MEDEHAYDHDQDLAELGHDTSNQNAPEGDALDQAEHDYGDSGEEADSVVREGGSIDLPTSFAEYHEATPEARAEMIVSRSWQGRLPAPEDLAKYSPEVQQEIIRWAGQSMAMEQQLVNSAVELDRDDSDRLNKLLVMEERERRFGQVATVVLDVAILAGVLYTASINQPWVAVILAGVLGGINAFSIFGKTGTKNANAETEDGTPPKGE